jgi:hypothetical protein
MSIVCLIFIVQVKIEYILILDFVITKIRLNFNTFGLAMEPIHQNFDTNL